MQNKTIRAFGGAFVAYAISNDVKKALEITERFTVDSNQYFFLVTIALILSKFGDEVKHDTDIQNKVEKFFNVLLRQGQIK